MARSKHRRKLRFAQRLVFAVVLTLMVVAAGIVVSWAAISHRGQIHSSPIAKTRPVAHEPETTQVPAEARPDSYSPSP